MIALFTSLMSLPVRIGALIILVTSLLGGIYIRGYVVGRESVQAADLRAENVLLQKKLKDTSAVLEAANQRAKASEAADQKLQEQINAYTASLPQGTGLGSCDLSDADVSRLFQLGHPSAKSKPRTAPTPVPAR